MTLTVISTEKCLTSNNRASLGLENKKLIKKLIILEYQNVDVKLRNF